MIIFDIIIAILYVLLILIFIILILALAIPAGLLYGLYWLLFRSWNKNKKHHHKSKNLKNIIHHTMDSKRKGTKIDDFIEKVVPKGDEERVE